MKKILSILMILVLVGGVAFAQIELAPEGSATLSWGIDLGIGDKAEALHGFNNEHELGLFIPFLYNRQAFKGGSADVADVYAKVNFRATPSVSSFWVDGVSVDARLHFYGAYITVYNKPDFDSAYAKGWAPINKATGWKAAKANWFAPSFEGYGTKIGYANKDLMGIDLGLKLGSDGNWLSKGKAGSSTKEYTKVAGDGTTVVGAADVYYALAGTLTNGDLVLGNKIATGTTLASGTDYVKETTVVKAGTPAVANHYAAGFDFEMTPVEKYLTLNATVNAVFDKDKYGTNDSGKQVNFGLGITSKPIEGMTIKAGFDGAAIDEFAWDAGLSAAYKWVDAALYFAGKGSGYEAGKDFNMNAHLAFTSEEEGDKNFVKGLAFGAVVNAYNLLSDYKGGKAIIPLGLMANVSYKAVINDSMWVKPYAAFYAESNHGADKVFGLAYKAGVVYQPLEKVEVEAAWNHGILAKNTYEGGFDGTYMIKTPLNNKGHNGRFVLSLKLIY